MPGYRRARRLSRWCLPHAVLATGIVAGGLGLASASASPADLIAELAYVPAPQRLVVFADLRSLGSSELREDVLRSGTARTATDAFEALTGIRVATDVDRFLAAFPEAGPQREPGAPLVIARGRFDPVRIGRLLATSGAAAAEYRGSRVMAFTDRDGARRAVAFLEPGLVAFGPDELVKRSIDVRGDAAGISTDPAFLSLLRAVNGEPIWAVGRFDELASRAGLPQGVVEQLPDVDWFSASGRVDTDVRIQARAEARDDAAAQELRDVLRGFAALIRVQPGPRKDWRALAASLEIGGEGRSVSLLFSAPAGLLGTLQHLSP